MTKLCQDILQSIITLAVDACDLEDYPMSRSCVPNYGEPPSPNVSPNHPSEALITLIRLSHINYEWRSLTLLVSRLWARHLRITRNMSPALLEEIAARTGDQAIHLHVSDIAFHSQIWLVTARLFERCVYLCFSRRHRPDFMEFIYTTPAPALERCDIVSEARAPVVVVWKPLFAGEAPFLEELRLVRTGIDCSSERPRFPDMPHSGLLSLGMIPGLTQLELNFPTNIARYFPSPSPFAVPSTFRLLSWFPLYTPSPPSPYFGRSARFGSHYSDTSRPSTSPPSAFDVTTRPSNSTSFIPPADCSRFGLMIRGY
ncbi:hypothetical protein FA13DRAFT_948007 [Coprinellus micaceus]|uniref:F-box domain-containing protein n=1 Tax=Coprinellus micaceus TaxID=71717 RepID=A0A4Y7SZL9_COPMI|nr:hypothetical protein FA13DRAFT_948007 [Coprinellus micaceus]